MLIDDQGIQKYKYKEFGCLAMSEIQKYICDNWGRTEFS